MQAITSNIDTDGANMELWINCDKTKPMIIWEVTHQATVTWRWTYEPGMEKLREYSITISRTNTLRLYIGRHSDPDSDLRL